MTDEITEKRRELWRIGCDALANRMDAIVRKLIKLEPYSCYDLGTSVMETFSMPPLRGEGFSCDFTAVISFEHRREVDLFTLRVAVTDENYRDERTIHAEMTTPDCPRWLFEIIPADHAAKLAKSKILFRKQEDPDIDVPF